MQSEHKVIGLDFDKDNIMLDSASALTPKPIELKEDITFVCGEDKFTLDVKEDITTFELFHIVRLIQLLQTIRFGYFSFDLSEYIGRHNIERHFIKKEKE